MDPISISILVGVALFQILSFGLQFSKTIRRSSCMGSNVEFRSSESIKNLDIKMPEAPGKK